MPYADLAARLPSRTDHWASRAFEAELTEWLSGCVGEVRVLARAKLRVWATVWTVETSDRRFFAKQNCQLQSFEAGLVAELAALVPDRVVPVAAVDAERGLLLTPDQGQVLSEAVAEDDLDVWERVVAAGADLQRSLVPHADRLDAAGLTRLGPADAPSYAAARLEELAGLPERDSRALGEEEAGALRAHLPRVQAWADQVAALGLPVTLNHNDLHDNNVFKVGEELRFFDFADSVLGDPHGCLLVPLNLLAHRLDAGPAGPRLWRVADAALEVWSDQAPLAELRRALPAALQLARLGRVESWAR